jgi:alkylated DNA nucleotide flippase Atl1
VSGLVVGRWLARVGPEDETPWWRVVGADGALLVARRDVGLAAIQRERLEREGVRFLEDGRVPAEAFIEP